MASFKNNLPQVLARVKAAVSEARTETAAEIEALSRVTTPVRTGQMRDSLGTVHGENESVIGFKVPYAVFVILGTSKQAANGFFLAAALAGVETYKQKVRQKLK